MGKTIDDVRAFWDTSPMLVGEIEEPAGTKAWFEAFDEIKTYDVFCGDLTDWVPADIEQKRVLDIGCGPGYWNRIFGKMDVEYHGIDISPKTVELAKVSRDLYHLRGDLRVGNAEQLDFPDGYFDYIVCESVLDHTPNTEQCINEIYRVLAPGGRASIGLFRQHFVYRSPLLFKASLALMRTLGISLQGRGREKMAYATSPQDFVRMYDGADNPVGRAFTKEEIKAMCLPFSEVKFGHYYLPSRVTKFNVPRSFKKRLASWLGLMGSAAFNRDSCKNGVHGGSWF